MRGTRRVPTTTRLAGLVAGFILAFGAHGDCYNDEVPARSDLEPPIPGSTGELLRVSDDDVKRMLEAIDAYEKRFEKAAADVPTASQK